MLATAATIAVVAALGGGPDRGTGTDAGPATTPQTPATVYFVGSTGVGDRLFSEVHPVADRSAAVQLALAGWADDPDYRSPWPAGTRVRSVTTDGGRVVVDLAGADLTKRPTGLRADDAALAVQQLVRTAGGGDGTQVAVEVDGARVDRLLGRPSPTRWPRGLTTTSRPPCRWPRSPAGAARPPVRWRPR